jgi:RHS repeat-associated protein
LNQYPSITLAGQSASTLAYDGNGNLTSGGGWTYSYDPENKLMTACNASPCGSASVAASYAYDPLGRRTEKSGTGVATTLFLNDGSDEIAEYSSSGSVLRRFVPGPAINEPIVYENCSGATAPNCTGSGPVYEYFQTDHHGSVVAMSGTSAAPVEGPYTYDGYGNGAPLTGVPFKFVGMYLDAETGLYYDRARYYSPLQGRFLQTDPIGYKDDLDMYAYVGNDPTDRIDPTGMDTWGFGVAYSLTLGGVVTGKGSFGVDLDGQGGVTLRATGGLQGGLNLRQYFSNLKNALLSPGNLQSLRKAAISESIQVEETQSNANSVNSLQGKFDEQTTEGGLGVGGSRTTFSGTDSSGSQISGSTYGVGEVVGGSHSEGQSYSKLIGPTVVGTPTGSSNSQPSRPNGSGWSANAGKTIPMQGSRICAPSSSGTDAGQRPNSC